MQAHRHTQTHTDSTSTTTAYSLLQTSVQRDLHPAPASVGNANSKHVTRDAADAMVWVSHPQPRSPVSVVEQVKTPIHIHSNFAARRRGALHNRSRSRRFNAGGVRGKRGGGWDHFHPSWACTSGHIGTETQHNLHVSDGKPEQCSRSGAGASSEHATKPAIAIAGHFSRPRMRRVALGCGSTHPHLAFVPVAPG